MMVTVPQKLLYTSAQSLSAAGTDVSSVHATNGVHLPNIDLGQQLPWLVDNSKIPQGKQDLQEVQYNFQPVLPQRKAPPQYKCHQDSQKRVLCHQKAVDLEHTHRQQVLRQRPFVDTQEDDIQQESNHKRVARQDNANHQDGFQQDRHQQGPPQPDGTQQQDPSQADGAQQVTPPSNGTQENAPEPQKLCTDTRCTCESKCQVVNADCSSSSLDQLPVGLHPSTTRLSLSGNNLQQIGNDSLAILTRVMLLYLDNNNITDVDKDAFSTMRNLRVVDLSNNLLSTLPSNVFTSNGKLLKLDLSWNPLHLTGGPLVESASLYWLNLSYCGLSSLPEGSFKGVPRMLMLDLSDNLLTVPTAVALETLNALKRLPLVGNPVSCCEVGELRTWLYEQKVSVLRRGLSEGPLPTCASPPELLGRPWTAADGHDACRRGLDAAAVVGCALLGLLLLAFLVAAALLLVRRRRRAARRRRTHSALRRQEKQMDKGDADETLPSQFGWEKRRTSAPRYVASWGKSSHPHTDYDDAVGAGRKASARQRGAPAPSTSPTYDDAVGDGRMSPQYDYILVPDGRRSVGSLGSSSERPPHHASIPSVLEGCDFYEEA